VKKLDVRGAKCPIPIVKAKKEIDQMQPGESLEVLSTDPGSMPDFRGWVQTSKTATLKEQRAEKDESGQEVFVHVLERR
jgi:TusA-related sulfurtransferase